MTESIFSISHIPLKIKTFFRSRPGTGGLNAYELVQERRTEGRETEIEMEEKKGQDIEEDERTLAPVARRSLSYGRESVLPDVSSV